MAETTLITTPFGFDSTAAGERTAADITATTGSTAVHVGRLDLADQASVAAFLQAGAVRCICSSTTPA